MGLSLSERGDEDKNLPLPGFERRLLLPVVGHFTD
jgi:hypothetical protein